MGGIIALLRQRRPVDSRLQQSVEAGNTSGAQAALGRGASVNTMSSHTLGNVGDKMAAEEADLDINKINWDLWPPTVHHDLELQLVEGAEPNEQEQCLDPADLWGSGHTPPMRGICFDSRSVKLTVQSGAQLYNSAGNTPLGMAISRGQNNEAMVLLKHGADINQQNNYGMTPLMKAVNFYDVFWNDDPILDLQYIQRKAYIFANLLLENGAMIDIQNKNKRTALMLACKNQDANTVRLLLSYGASVNLQDINWRSALMYASEVGDKKSVRLLLECGAEVDMLDKKGYTALMLACMNKYDSVMAILLKYKADTSLKNREWKTVFDIAAEVNSTFVFQQDSIRI